MLNFLNVLFPNKIVGVDIGTSAIKIVELSSWGRVKKLENYGQMQSSFISQGPSGSKAGSIIVPGNLASLAIREFLSEAKIKA